MDEIKLSNGKVISSEQAREYIMDSDLVNCGICDHAHEGPDCEGRCINCWKPLNPENEDEQEYCLKCLTK